MIKATRPEEAVRHLEAGGLDLMLSDINLEASMDGLDLLRLAKPLGVETILLTGFGTLERALEAVREGAFDFLSKPWNNEELKSLVKRALLMKESKEGRKPADRAPDRRQSVMIGSSPAMMEVYRTIASLQNSRTTVLIVGESGTGKELVARNIHASSDRRDRPFVAINCGALAEGLLESELFGHVKGAFTGAVSDKKGFFEEATGGHHLPGRDRRDLRQLPGAPAAGAAGAGDPAGGQQPDRQGGRAGDRRLQPGPGPDGQGRQVPGGPLLPPVRGGDPGAAGA